MWISKSGDWVDQTDFCDSGDSDWVDKTDFCDSDESEESGELCKSGISCE